MIIKQRDIMIDLETLATSPNSVVISVAALRFDPFADDSNTNVKDMDHFYARVNLESFDWPEAEISEDTLAWWATQSPEAQEAAFGDGVERLDIREAMTQLFEFCKPIDRIWANAPSFDAVILETHARKLKMQVPWQYWMHRDTRTIFKMVDGLEKRNASHDALDDCWRQVVDLQNCLRRLNVTKMN